MEEQQLEIRHNGEYKNITVKTRYEWDKNAKQFKFDSNGDKIVKEQGIKPDHYVIVTKKFLEGREVQGNFGVSYSCAVTYGDEDVTFWLNEFQHRDFAKTGGEGDNIKVSCEVVERLNKKLGVKVPVEVIKFAVV